VPSDAPLPSAMGDLPTNEVRDVVAPPPSYEHVMSHREVDPKLPVQIHPIIIYPFVHPRDTQHLRVLYNYLESLRRDSGGAVYAKPLTIINRQTMDRVTANPTIGRQERNSLWNDLVTFLNSVVKPVSELTPAWCVDTCQMWLRGLGDACDNNKAAGGIYWLIPGDFHYAGPSGQEVLAKMSHIPLTLYRENGIDLAIGEISVPLNSAKQLIDTYGTYGLLYNWFPAEAQAIRQVTDKPRTEFFAISDGFLRYVLSKRWYGYEQTIVILLHAFVGSQLSRNIRRIDLGNIADDEVGRSRLDVAMQQVERTERVLKLFWRERNTTDRDWREKFRRLDLQSEQVRNSAMIILEQILS
jgi:hypothetical protein